MTDKYNYRSVSLRNKTHAKLEKLSNIVVKGEKLSIPKTVEKMINDGVDNEVCSTCQCEFDLDAEGGTKGEFGILPVAFCPTCLSSIFDMVEKLK